MTDRTRRAQTQASGHRQQPCRVIRLVGEGGMSTVWEAHHPTWGRVALKRPRPDSDARRFHQEATLLEQLQHPGVVRCFGSHHGRSLADSWLAMEFLDGPNLGAWVGRNPGGLGERITAAVATRLCEALSYCYRQPVRVDGTLTNITAHLDVKPNNVHVAVRGSTVCWVKLMDFGIAHLVHQGAPGEVVGQPEFLAPERVHGGVPTWQCDVFSLGVLMYQMLTGRLPFWGRSDQEIVDAIRTATPAPMTGVSREMEALVLRCLDKDPYARPHSMAAMQSTLESVTHTRQLQRVPVQPPNAPRAGGPWLILVCMLLLLAAPVGATLIILFKWPVISPVAIVLAAMWFLPLTVSGVWLTVHGAIRRRDRAADKPRAERSPRRRTQEPAVAVLRVTSGNHAGKKYSLRTGCNTLGRGEHCDVSLQVGDFAISRFQGQITIRPGGPMLSSSGQNAIIVNGQTLIDGTVKLTGRASLCIGRTYFEYVPLRCSP